MVSSGTQVCPECDALLTNHDIVGYEVRGVYDGILFWICKQCGKAFQRFTDGGLKAKAAPYIAEWNAQLERSAGGRKQAASES